MQRAKAYRGISSFHSLNKRNQNPSIGTIFDPQLLRNPHQKPHRSSSLLGFSNPPRFISLTPHPSIPKTSSLSNPTPNFPHHLPHSPHSNPILHSSACLTAFFFFPSNSNLKRCATSSRPSAATTTDPDAGIVMNSSHCLCLHHV